MHARSSNISQIGIPTAIFKLKYIFRGTEDVFPIPCRPLYQPEATAFVASTVVEQDITPTPPPAPQMDSKA